HFYSGCCRWLHSPPLLVAFNPRVPVRRRHPVVQPPRPIYHPVTAVCVRNKGNVGIVPMHPLDAKGKTPLNLERGVFSPAGSKGVNEQVIPGAPGQKWARL